MEQIHDIGDWRAQAACLDEDPELFFPAGTTGIAAEQIELAKKVCGSCPVIAKCFEVSIENKESFGVWGGVSEEERKRILRLERRRRRFAN